MNGKIVAGFVVASGLIAGIAIYYLQVYGYYTRLDPTGAGDVTLVAQATDTAEPIEYDAFQAIDANKDGKVDAKDSVVRVPGRIG